AAALVAATPGLARLVSRRVGLPALVALVPVGMGGLDATGRLGVPAPLQAAAAAAALAAAALLLRAER
ncbi:MAG TPA: hypothetical protein VF406_14495, partial [Thermodesulfobacteriota bacterium]